MCSSDLELQEMRGLILDLRNNPGGYLQSAVTLVDEFVDETSMPIVSQKSESGVFDDSERFATKGMRPDYPVVVLVNGSSASASEIVAGALQDFERARLIGKKTFGKGSVSNLWVLQDGSGVNFTIAHWFTPNGTLIEGEGLSPDVQLDKVEDGSEDVHLNRAIELLRKQIAQGS